ncbi:acetyl-CoA carboxylase biotin carboxylase subunit (plasmid) [Bosea sp. F3-2]|uniref:acetyl-CoA carboxylase biotin carboxylase subunit n=1 Tax=Bosea sp. F3-2 TaxID=2599640 RepID=UPI0011F02862|nr:acetyl-CoA carboxylase biotin carboxylase subunit [Bosea sp. F3-2]QEL27342.1 acetyl-CoA carboxylase biotin carboxylase subunit [Bosea sp. F3-2]
MFDTVLIANRGEIALRIQRGCRKLGLRCVQAFSEADAGAPYVRLADAAVCVGPAPSAGSYLNKQALVVAARASGAQAIHPGYGFLSENADFAELVEEQGLVFVGPPASAIRLMGDKISAKRAMIAAGVPCVPGYEGGLEANESSLSIAREVGFPIIVKAAGGGGGRGMRIVHEESELISAISMTREEAGRAFGNPTVYLERFLQTPRHIEIQIVADGHGNCVWIGERDCSVQRRHQKIIEEAPAFGVPRDLLARVGESCVAACRSIGYRGAGTFEFLYENGELYFIEMNTRLQVEHTVTEMVSGLDIVELQLRVARGEALPLGQQDIRIFGHAIECRINAEDPDSFMPSAGRVTFWHAPGGPGVRVDSHLASGYVVPPNYDSMIAKAITHGPTRAEAIARMQGALSEIVVEGIRTNVPLHRELLTDPQFTAGGVSIHFLEDRKKASAS